MASAFTIPTNLAKRTIRMGWILLPLLLASCTYSLKFTGDYYKENEQTLVSIRERYERLYAIQPFSLDLMNKELSQIGIELMTDTMKYVYNFTLTDRSFPDTLSRYHLDLKEMSLLIRDMQKLSLLTN